MNILNAYKNSKTRTNNHLVYVIETLYPYVHRFTHHRQIHNFGKSTKAFLACMPREPISDIYCI